MSYLDDEKAALENAIKNQDMDFLLSLARSKLKEVNRVLSFRKKDPCEDCVDGFCEMNCGPVLRKGIDYD